MDGLAVAAIRATRTRWLLAAAALVGSVVPAAGQPDPILRGVAWGELVLVELIPAWQAHVIDSRHDGFHMSLGRDWQPRPPHEKGERSRVISLVYGLLSSP